MKNDLIMLLPDLRAFSRLLCCEREAADDLLQDTVATALARQHEFEADGNLKAWLFAIMRTHFHSAFPSSRHHADAVLAPIHADCTVMMDLSAALWRLNPYYREALILTGASGFSYAQAAQLCGCAVGTMKSRVSRARRQLAGAIPARRSVPASFRASI